MTEIVLETARLRLEPWKPEHLDGLNAMAADRAVTMQTTIQNNFRQGGHPPAANIAPERAKGSAKMECSHLIISSVVPTFRHRAIDRV